MHDLSLDEIKRIVKKALRDDLGRRRIIDVQVIPDFDGDGDKVLRIDVVMRGAVENADAEKLSGVMRTVRPELRNLGEDAFPLFSFVSGDDPEWEELEPA